MTTSSFPCCNRHFAQHKAVATEPIRNRMIWEIYRTTSARKVRATGRVDTVKDTVAGVDRRIVRA